MMKGTRRVAGLAVAALLAAAPRAGAQVSVSVGCSPGIPGCTSLRFFTEAVGGVAIDQLFITLLTPPWHFTSGPSSSVGTYSAQDSFGPFSGFTNLGPGGTSLFIDFLGDNGFPFDVLDGDTGTLDLPALGTGSTDGLYYTVTGITDDGGRFTVSNTPEPASIVLLATGLGALGIAWRKRKKAEAA